MPIDMTVQIGPMTLKNPVMTASGTFGYGEEFHDEIYDISRLGAVVVKGLSLQPREGNPPPRIAETASGMLNSIGLANCGLDVFLGEKIPFLEKAGAVVIVNIFGETIDEFGELAGRLDECTAVHGVELNISCPNVQKGGAHFGNDPKTAAKVVKLARKNFSRALIVKPSPLANVTEIAHIAKTCGADAVTVANSFPAMAIDAEKMAPKLGNVFGGLSGPAIKPIALKMVFDCARAVNVPVIASGGIMTTADAVEFLLAGATAIQIGTANFVDPQAAVKVIAGIRDYCVRHGFGSIRELVGKLAVA